MVVPLLQTKLYIPSRRPEWVSRPHLIERLNAGLSRKLTLVSAPAGFGKTSLLSEWIHGMGTDATSAGIAPAPPHVAWLSLDKGDNDLPRFLAYLVTALQTIESSLGRETLAALESPEAGRPEIHVQSVLTLLLNQIAGLSDRLVLVLDDYHVIESRLIHQALTFLLEHLPPPAVGGLHTVIATRSDPFLPLSRLRARRDDRPARGRPALFPARDGFLNPPGHRLDLD